MILNHRVERGKRRSRAGRMLVGAATVVTLLAVAWIGARTPAAPVDELGDAEVHALPQSKRVPRPAVADPERGGRLRLTVLDGESGRPTFCRINVVGSDGNCYEPSDNPLSPWSLQRLGNRKDKGPFRHYGWFFYCSGDVELTVPAGKTRVDVWKGLEFVPQSAEVDLPLGRAATATVTLTRAVDMASRGWFSGDTHIHFDRRTPLDDERALDLAAAEDIRFAHILCMNDPRTYQPVMESQIHPQDRGMGPASEVFRGNYGIASGQEYRCNTYGHICLVGGSRLVDADGLRTNPNEWPLFGEVADQLHGLGGYAFHAHGGYEQEIYADFAQQATDGVELLQFAVYRGVGLDGWYHILNAGFRFPAVGASDYPYCRALGDCRTYVFLGGRGATPEAGASAKGSRFAAWNKAAAEGRSVMTTGPLIELSVEGRRPGDTFDLAAGHRETAVEVELRSPVAGVSEIHLIEGGQVRARRRLNPGESRGPIRWRTTVSLDRSTWIAVRAFAASPSGREDVEAHTNPVYVTVAGTSAIRSESAEWLIRKLDALITVQQARSFPQKERVVAYYVKSREILKKLLHPASDAIPHATSEFQ